MTNRFARTRQDHRQENAEDYVELIDQLARESGRVRTVDLAARLGVSHVTVGKTLQRLRREGLVEESRYQPLALTPAGRDLAEKARERHEVVVRFLCSLGVSEANAETDAEGIEHHVSDETLDAMRRALGMRA